MSRYTQLRDQGFFGQSTPQALVAAYGSPLYVYNESVLRMRAREMRDLITGVPFQADFSVKANGNLSLLRIIHQEGLHGDAMSPGEIQLLLDAGFAAHEILFVPNNVDDDEMRYAIERNVLISVDSLSQLDRLGRLHPGGRVAVRFNPGVGAGHHRKVITGGKLTKFGVHADDVAQVQQLLRRYQLTLAGITQHIGSLFMDETPYHAAMQALLSLAEQFPPLEFVDFGGGFGVPYHKQEGEKPLDLQAAGRRLSNTLGQWCDRVGYTPLFRAEPGRYVVAECGALLGRVLAVKHNEGTTYVGTDMGCNTLIRPVLYDAHHDIEVYTAHGCDDGPLQTVTVVGNICETGDILAGNRVLPRVSEEDILAVCDAGAYGYAQSSCYNMRMRPAEVLIDAAGQPRLIRRRDTYAMLMMGFEGLE